MIRLAVIISTITAFLFFTIDQSSAVNFYDGYRAVEGLYFLTYSSVYCGDKTTNDEGKTAIKNYEYHKIEEIFRLSYYKKSWVLTALVPLGYVHSGFYDVSSYGLGDIITGGGYFLPFNEFDVLPMFTIKLPTGEYDSRKSVNYGSNQYDIRTTLFIYKAIDKLSFDGAIQYRLRLENPDTKVSPGDELRLESLLGWQLSKTCKAGPSLSWMKSSNRKLDGIKVADSRRETFSVGGDIYFRLKPFSLTFTYLHDVYAKNTIQGDFFQIKTCYKF
ncbi:MAG: transporter [Candidatus Omnitrophica bacterium]|nr:transporter [Candidatus Omnitrophota bacterium]